MQPANNHLNASDAAGRLGVSTKALRLYEARGLISPGRTSAGYRVYRPEDMASAAKVVALRALGLSLAQTAEVFAGDARCLDNALASHETVLNEDMHRLASQVDRIRQLRTSLAQGTLPDAGDIDSILGELPTTRLSVPLPWPWNGEHFDIPDAHPLNYIVGPLGSGKTVLAHCIADAVPGSVFFDATQTAPMAESGLDDHLVQATAWLTNDGASPSPMLTRLLEVLESDAPSLLVIDSMEEHLDAATQDALMRYLRKQARRHSRPLFLITRSAAILDLDCVEASEAIYFCPANHRPPFRLLPYRGTTGYESIDACLASAAIRARTRGMTAHLHGR